ncbi:MAG: dihydrodipicolinate synthase family protein [Alphaproteobacteria bacterium]|nr:dihydrodipicolinate synthase family protein [Alphaproteobacteria bacterium]
MPQPLSGVFAAVLTPQKPDLSPDYPAFVAHGKWLLAQGCHGLGILGTTGEANSFSVDERIRLMEAAVQGGIDPAKLMPGTGCCAITDTVALTKRAVALGAAGVLVLPPFYYKKISDAGLYRSFAELVDRVGDARLRVYIYHFPAMTGLETPIAVIARLREAYPGVFVGLKDSGGKWEHMEALLRAFPGFGLFAGTERYLLATLRAGGAGTISATTNVTGGAARQVFDAYLQGSTDVEAQQERLTAMRAAIEAYPLVAALKSIMADWSGRPAWKQVRPPLDLLDAAAEAKLLAAVGAAGLSLPKAA